MHDHQVAEDYYAAMSQVEKRLDLANAEDVKVPLDAGQRSQLLDLTEQLAVGTTKHNRMNWAVWVELFRLYPDAVFSIPTSLKKTTNSSTRL